jgi:hypothetical protein
MRALRKRRAWSGTVPAAGESPATPRPVAKPDKQVSVAVLEAYSISGAFLRLSHEARPQLAWRCEKTGVAIRDALMENFKEVS